MPKKNLAFPYGLPAAGRVLGLNGKKGAYIWHLAFSMLLLLYRRMLIPYLRPFWYFIIKKYLHQKMVYLTIAKFFTIVLEYNSKLRIVL